MIRIYGASDDLVEIEGDHNEEVDALNDEVKVTIGTDAGGLLVLMRYAAGGMGFATWTAEVGQMAENVEIPWPVHIGHAMRGSRVGYSVTVEVDCPPGTPVRAERMSGEPSA